MMTVTSPVYTTENECQDCYKCVRHCPVKAIRIVNGKASVIPEACVACGECVKVCPAHAKKIRSDLARLKELVASGAKLYASIAPSFAGYFKGVTIGQIAAALKAAVARRTAECVAELATLQNGVALDVEKYTGPAGMTALKAAIRDAFPAEINRFAVVARAEARPVPAGPVIFSAICP